MIADVKYARLRKFNFPDRMLRKRSMLKRNGNIVLKHTDDHRFIFGGLALQMINVAADPDNGVRDHGSEFFIMFIPQLFKGFLLTVGSVENFIDQRNQKLWHFLCNCPEYIIKNSAVFCSVFLVGI